MNSVCNAALFAVRRQLVDTESDLAVALLTADGVCRSNKRPDNEALQQSCAALLAAIPDRASLRLAMQAYGGIVYAATYGQSPYECIMSVLYSLLNGQALFKDPTRGMRYIYEHLFEVYAPPAARSRVRVDGNTVEQRYPRLLRAMRAAAILSHTEANATLLLLLRTAPRDRCHASPSCEAVAHFGGAMKVVRAAKRYRRLFPSMRLTREAVAA